MVGEVGSSTPQSNRQARKSSVSRLSTFELVMVCTAGCNPRGEKSEEERSRNFLELSDKVPWKRRC